MDSSSLTPEQAERLRKALFPCVNYLVRLRQRMHERGFPHDDKLYRLVCDAYDAAYRLSVEVHYLSCKGGVGRPSREP